MIVNKICFSFSFSRNPDIDRYDGSDKADSSVICSVDTTLWRLQVVVDHFRLRADESSLIVTEQTMLQTVLKFERLSGVENHKALFL